MEKKNRDMLEKALAPHKWLRIAEVVYDLEAAAKTAELATHSVFDDGDAYDMYAVMEVLLTAVKRACGTLKESAEEWQSSGQPYWDEDDKNEVTTE